MVKYHYYYSNIIIIAEKVPKACPKWAHDHIMRLFLGVRSIHQRLGPSGRHGDYCSIMFNDAFDKLTRTNPTPQCLAVKLLTSDPTSKTISTLIT